MRYFKYKNTNENRNNALREQYLTLTKDEKRIVRKEKTWRISSMIVSAIVFIICVAASVFLLKIIPLPEEEWLEILVTIGKVFGGFLLFFASGFLTYAITYPLWKKVESFQIPQMKKEIFSKACAHLREFYGLQSPYIVTKCYRSTDEKFNNRDVCVFVFQDELRITVDLVKGFLHGKRDLGCYAFKKDEIVLAKKQEGSLLIAELKVGDTVFLLGYRAKSFIGKVFLMSGKKSFKYKELILDALIDDDEAFTQIVEFFAFCKETVSPVVIKSLLDEMVQEGYLCINESWKNEHGEYPYSLTEKGKNAWKKIDWSNKGELE